jgi:AmmeMemoRadiSam system protein A/AmmeMemoRadiSam system protein B
MANRNCLVFSGIAPHPPIMVPSVGREAIAEVRSSIDAMAELTKRLLNANAETVILISPHAPLELDSFVAYDGPELHGDFANFRAPQTQLMAPVDEDLLNLITKHAASKSFAILRLSDCKLDHGTAVPLYFLLQNGWRGKVVALGYSFLSTEDHLRFGECISRAVDELARPVAFVASGDLSHRLKPDAPAGYNSGAYLFDEQVCHALNLNDPQSIAVMNQDLRRLAGECGYRSILVALGATHEMSPQCEVISYEAPFGVGYLVAQITGPSNSSVTLDDLALLARKAVETFTREKFQIQPEAHLSPLLRAPSPCFVSLKTLDGELRGCIGTIEATKQSLAEEIIANAISASTRDPRFSEVTEGELTNLRYSVDVLMPSEPAEMDDLDPRVFGVIVEDEDGRRGLLLPDIPGVDDARQQVEIATRKAGIRPGAPIQLFRFRVQRFREADPPIST